MVDNIASFALNLSKLPVRQLMAYQQKPRNGGISKLPVRQLIAVKHGNDAPVISKLPVRQLIINK